MLGYDWRREWVELLFNGYEVLLLQDKFPEIDGVNGCTTKHMHLAPWNCTFNTDLDDKICYACFTTINI